MAHQRENPFIFWGIIGLVVLVVIALAIGLLLLFYRLLYGIPLKKLKHNYKELIKLED
jgi:dolichyl-phosphate-mannose--protein O-mannosyl transferase